MSESATQSTAFDFGKFVPGFDFLQNLTQAAAKNTSPSASAWVAPTMNVEDIQKRIEELKAVQFWLEQNSRALSATIQALEVQKMTISTLSAMNVSMGDLAAAFQVKPTVAEPEVEAEVEEAEVEESTEAVTEDDVKTAPEAAAEEPPQPAEAKASNGAVDPLAWWGAVTQQFQEIAAQVLKDVPLPQAASAEVGKNAKSAKTTAKTTTSKSNGKPSRKTPAKKAGSPAGAKRAAKPAAKKV